MSEISVSAILGMIEALPEAPPTTIVSHPYVLRGAPWKMVEDGHIYYFANSADILALPQRDAVPGDARLLMSPNDTLCGIPVREFDEDMRDVFIRGLERSAAIGPADLTEQR